MAFPCLKTGNAVGSMRHLASEVGGHWQDFVFDAKYRYVAGTVGVPDRELGLPGGRSLMITEQMDCLVKYKLGCIASDTGLAPRAVWLLCGRLTRLGRRSRVRRGLWPMRAVSRRRDRHPSRPRQTLWRECFAPLVCCGMGVAPQLRGSVG